MPNREARGIVRFNSGEPDMLTIKMTDEEVAAAVEDMIAEAIGRADGKSELAPNHPDRSYFDDLGRATESQMERAAIVADAGSLSL